MMRLQAHDGSLPLSFEERYPGAEFTQFIDGARGGAQSPSSRNDRPDATDATKLYFEALRKGDAQAVSAALKKSPETGLSINAVDKNGNNALQVLAAANISSTDVLHIMKSLIRMGVDILHKNKAGKTAGDIAQSSADQAHAFGSRKVALLAEGEKMQFLQSIYQGTEERSIAFLERAVEAGRAWELLDQEVLSDVSVLMFAAGNNNPGVVKAIVRALKGHSQKQDYLDRKGPDGYTALHAALKHEDVADILKEAGASEDLENDDGHTPDELVERALKRRDQDDWWDPESNFFFNLAKGASVKVNDFLNWVPTGYGDNDYVPPAEVTVMVADMGEPDPGVPPADGYSPIMGTTAELQAMIAHMLLGGPDVYRAFQDVRSLWRTNRQFRAVINASLALSREYDRLEEGVLTAEAVWDEILPLENEHPNPSSAQMRALVASFAFVSQEARDRLVNMVLCTTDGATASVRLMQLVDAWPFLTDEQRKALIDEALSISFYSRRPLVALLPWLGDIDERPEGERTPAHPHAPDSRAALLINELIDAESVRELGPAFAHMDQGQQDAALDVMQNLSEPGDMLTYRAMEYITPAARSSLINQAFATMQRPSASEGERVDALSVLFASLSEHTERQGEILSWFGQINNPVDVASLFRSLWPSLGSLDRRPDGERTPDHSHDADSPISELVNRVIAIEDPVERLRAFIGVGDGLSALDRRQQQQIIDAALSAIATPLAQIADVDIPEFGHVRGTTLAGLIAGARHLTSSQREGILDFVVGLSTSNEQNFAGVLRTVSSVLDRLTDSEMNRLWDAAIKLSDPVARASALSALSMRDYPGDGSSNQRRDLSEEPSPAQRDEEVERLEGEGYDVIEDGDAYEDLMDDPDTFALIERGEDLRDGIVVINRYDATRDGTGRGDPNKQYVLRVESTEVKKLVSADLAFQKKLGKELDYKEVFRIRFLKTDTLTPGMREAADHFLRNSELTKEEERALWDDISDRGWTAKQFQDALDGNLP